MSRVLGVVARRLGANLTYSGNLYYLGELRPEDRGVLVRRAPRLSSEELRHAVEALLSEVGRMVSFVDGLVVVSDRVEVLERVVELLDRLESVPVGSWVVQLHVLLIADSDKAELGLEVAPSAELALSFAAASDLHLSGGFTATGGLDVLLRAVLSSSRSRVVCEPLFVVRDGEISRYEDGQEVPIPRKTVSGEGTVTVSGYDYRQTGVTISVDVREFQREAGLLGLSLELGELVRYVEEVPVVDRRRFETAAVVNSGGVYLLGSISLDRQRHTTGGGLGTVFGVDDGKSQLDVWARVYQIAGPAARVPGVPGDGLAAGLRSGSQPSD